MQEEEEVSADEVIDTGKRMAWAIIFFLIALAVVWAMGAATISPLADQFRAQQTATAEAR